VPLKEQMAGSKQTKVAVVTSFGQPAQVHKEKFKALKERTDRQHRHDWLHHEATGVISAVVTDFSASDCSDTEPDSDDDTLPQRTDTPLERRHARLRFLRVDGLFDHRLHGGYSANAAAV